MHYCFVCSALGLRFYIHYEKASWGQVVNPLFSFSKFKSVLFHSLLLSYIKHVKRRHVIWPVLFLSFCYFSKWSNSIFRRTWSRTVTALWHHQTPPYWRHSPGESSFARQPLSFKNRSTTWQSRALTSYYQEYQRQSHHNPRFLLDSRLSSCNFIWYGKHLSPRTQFIAFFNLIYVLHILTISASNLVL